MQPPDVNALYEGSVGFKAGCNVHGLESGKVTIITIGDSV